MAWTSRTTPLRTALRAPSLSQIRHVTPVPFGAATGTSARVYREVEREFGVLAPPIVLHSPSAPVLAASWVLLRETLLAPGSVDRATKEAVSTAVSLGNECPFCVTMHHSTMRFLVDGDIADAVAAGRPDSIADEHIRNVVGWVTARSTDPGTAGAAPFPEEQVAELVGVAVLLQYLNRMVNVFLGDLPLPPWAPSGALRPILRVLRLLMGAAYREPSEPGASLDLLPAAEPQADLAWAAGNDHVAGAYARACAAIDAAGVRSVPASVRHLVCTEVADWHGEPRPLDRAWLDRPVADLPTEDRAAGRVAMLTAFASYRLDDAAVAEFRQAGPGDDALIELTAWASMTAARRVGGWLTS